MLRAPAYRDVRHDVLIVNTRELLRLEEPNIRLSRMNSGCTRPFAHPRNLELFQTLSDYPFERRRKKYGSAKALAEVCVTDGVELIGGGG